MPNKEHFLLPMNPKYLIYEFQCCEFYKYTSFNTGTLWTDTNIHHSILVHCEMIHIYIMQYWYTANWYKYTSFNTGTNIHHSILVHCKLIQVCIIQYWYTVKWYKYTSFNTGTLWTDTNGIYWYRQDDKWW